MANVPWLWLDYFLVAQPFYYLTNRPNHLDIATVAGLTEAIQATNATVLVITHDRRLAGAIGDSILAVGNGIVQRDTNGVDGWLRQPGKPLNNPWRAKTSSKNATTTETNLT